MPQTKQQAFSGSNGGSSPKVSLNFPINDNDRIIFLQFSFPNDDAVPLGLRSVGKENGEMSQRRRAFRSNPTGKDLLSGNYPQKVNLADMAASLTRHHYVLVNATYQKRQDQHNPKKYYHAIRYTFVRSFHEDRDNEELKKFLPYRGLSLAELQGICEMALWRVRLFRNLYFKSEEDFFNNNPVPGQHAISINLEARVPLFETSKPSQSLVPNCQPDWAMSMKNSALELRKMASA